MRLSALLLLSLALPAHAQDREAVSALIEALADKDRGVRYAAVQALGKARAVPDCLSWMLGDPEWCVRQEAGIALAEIASRSCACAGSARVRRRRAESRIRRAPF